MKNKIFVLLVCLLLIPTISAVEPPWVQQENCENSGGDWTDFRCTCPSGTTSLWLKCWVKTPEEVCQEFGGEITSEPIPGPIGSDFRCMKDGGDITQEARENAILNTPSLWQRIMAWFKGFFKMFSISSEEVGDECVKDEDCVDAICCHASECVPLDQKPDCSGMMCTLNCEPGTLDCGQGSCMCVKGVCKAVLSS